MPYMIAVSLEMSDEPFFIAIGLHATWLPAKPHIHF